MEVFNNIIGGLLVVTLCVGVMCCGLSMLIDAWRAHRNRHDDLVAAERSRKIALWLNDAAYWFGTEDGDASLVLQEISGALARSGHVFDVEEVRDKCRAAVKAAKAKEPTRTS